MNKIRPLLIRDNIHSRNIFTIMIISLFMIVGPIALHVKAALAGMAVLIFFTMFIILIYVKYTDKTCPRYIVFLDNSLKLIFWDRHEEDILFSDIKRIEIGGISVKVFDGVLKIYTEKKMLMVKTEIYDNVSTLVKLLQGRTEILYGSDYMKNVIQSALKENDFSEKIRLILSYGFVLLFLIMAVFINLQIWG